MAKPGRSEKPKKRASSAPKAEARRPDPIAPLRKLASRIGAFPADLPQKLVERFTCPGDIVLDPFCGKGTTLLEAAVQGRTAIGVDAAYDAYVLSQAKSEPATLSECLRVLQDLRCRSLREPLRYAPVDEAGSLDDDARAFFHPKTFDQILWLKHTLLRLLSTRQADDDKVTYRFLQAVFLGIMHGYGPLSLSVPMPSAYSMHPEYIRRKLHEDEKRIKRGWRPR